MKSKNLVDEKSNDKTSSASFSYEEVKGEENVVKVRTFRNGQQHEIAVIAISEEDLKKVNNLESELAF